MSTANGKSTSVPAASRVAAETLIDLLYCPPRWLPTNHAQTIIPALFARLPAVDYRRERWTTPDGDFIELDWIAYPEGSAAAPLPDAPLFVLFHGLEGSSDSHYARVLMATARGFGWHGVVPHFRSCSGPLNLAPRFYHLADSAEVDWVLRRLRDGHRGPIVVAGVSLGGNVLLHWLGERGTDAAFIAAAAAVSTPLDVHAGGRALSQGFALVYTLSFLKTLKKKALQKLEQYPGLFDRDAMLASRTMYDYDNVVTAPLHGFRNTDDYWTRATTRPLLPDVVVPTLVLNARNDPFLPSTALPTRAEVSPAIELDQPEAGGHVGFMTGPFPGRMDWLPRRVFSFLEPYAKNG
ncbi:YheT family hydrolase [Trinickia symbiotica]|uniref:YheT family hydrolase n=1 Tax=Trinickia symbiotica TaxID=863227 RepID=UPI0015E7B0D3|nr:alpha/beta fold hydrolase [Trinickia symbiotica]